MTKDVTTIDVRSIEKIEVLEGEKLLVTVDVSKLNESEAFYYMKSVETFMYKIFKDKVVIIPQNITIKSVKE